MTSFLSAPFELVWQLGRSARALAELPVALEQSLRETNALIAETRTHLTLLANQVERMMEQLDKMATVADRLVDGTKAIAENANDAKLQMASTSEQIAAANRSLEQIVRLTEPIDRMSKKVVDRLLRVTGGRSSDDPA